MSNWHLVIMAVVGVFSSANADLIFVDDDNCPGPGSGMEGDPYCLIQTAIDNAVDTDEIVVAPGTYFETIDFIGKAITLRSSDGSDVTIIDGTGFFHVVQCVSGEGPDTVLDGFTITGGNANGGFPDNRGGGMANRGLLTQYPSPTVTSCTFNGNSAASGGGMWSDESDPTVTNCTFSGNSADRGGGDDGTWTGTLAAKNGKRAPLDLTRQEQSLGYCSVTRAGAESTRIRVIGGSQVRPMAEVTGDQMCRGSKRNTRPHDGADVVITNGTMRPFAGRRCSDHKRHNAPLGRSAV